jgi:large subunit ribosomal protein L30
MAAKLRVTLVKSPISHTQTTRGTVRALGLHRIGETVEVPDNPQTRGMARAVRFLLHTEEIADGGNGQPTNEPTATDADPQSAGGPKSTTKNEETA